MPKKRDTEKTTPATAEVSYHSLTPQQTLRSLHTAVQGLNEAEIAKRLEILGPNRLPEEKKTLTITIFFRQFKSSLILILIIAAGISYFLGDELDMYVILAAVALNVFFGFIQELKAQKAFEQLKKIITLQALVIRDGQEKRILAEQLTLGDIIVLNAGDKVPADARMLEVQDLEANEAALTGESVPIRKIIEVLKAGTVLAERENMVYTGTVVTRGQGKGVVTAIGAQTEIGQIATLLAGTKEELTPLQKKLNRFSRGLAIIVLALSALVLAIGLIGDIAFNEIFLTSVALAVAAIPEGLVVAVTAVLAIGMQRILRKQGLVRKLVAAETLGSTTVICTDKTGTLTSGQMQVVQIVTWDADFSGHPAEVRSNLEDTKRWDDYLLALKIGVISNDAFIINPEDDIHEWEIGGNLTERALLLAGIQAGLEPKELKKEFVRIDTIPFDSDIKFMATLHRTSEGNNVAFLKGAPEKVLAMVSHVHVKEVGATQPLTKEREVKLRRMFTTLSRQGLRVIALGYREVPKNVKDIREVCAHNKKSDFIFLGFVGIKDPLRPQVKETMSLCKRAGIHIVMITGDNRDTAGAIAKELGIPAQKENILEGQELMEINDEALKQRVQEITVYARVSPKDKLRIVDAWQSNGHVVAMTGDGINDSPAIKAADIGVALGSGTDVTKETADLVILDNDFKTIVVAVEEGRGIFENLRKIILYLLSDSFSEIILVIGSLLMGVPLPLAAAQILWINLITDGLPNLALTVEPKEKEIMNEPPINPKEPLLRREGKWLIFLISAVTGLGNLLLFLWILHTANDLTLARSVVFASLGIESLLYVFSIRSLRHSIFTQNPFSNPSLILAVVAGVLLQLAALYLPILQNFLKTTALGTTEWGLILLWSALMIGLIEAVKLIFYARKNA